MTRDDLAKETARLVALHHDAFLVDLFGVDGSGLPESRVTELRDAGMIEDEPDFDPYVFMLSAGHVFDATPHDEHEALRNMTIEDFEPLIEERVATLEEREPSPVTFGGIEQPPIEATQTSDLRDAAPPAWMSPAEGASYQRLVRRAGEYVRGLGNALSEELADVAAEGWQGQEIVEEVIPEQREAMLSILREEASRESATGRDARRLAGTLADRTEYYAHNWLRIAQTELQGGHNEGRAITALDNYGDGAQVARVPESDACDHCLELLTDGEGPIVFDVINLMANGVNVGRARHDWKPTVYPIHPNCRCDTISVPRGFRVLADGRLRKKDQDV